MLLARCSCFLVHSPLFQPPPPLLRKIGSILRHPFFFLRGGGGGSKVIVASRCGGDWGGLQNHSSRHWPTHHAFFQDPPNWQHFGLYHQVILPVAPHTLCIPKLTHTVCSRLIIFFGGGGPGPTCILDVCFVPQYGGVPMLASARLPEDGCWSAGPGPLTRPLEVHVHGGICVGQWA